MTIPLLHLLVGQVLYGYCGGWFGRDSYANKRIEAVGVDWVVARENGNDVVFASGENIHEELKEYTNSKHNINNGAMAAAIKKESTDD